MMLQPVVFVPLGKGSMFKEVMALITLLFGFPNLNTSPDDPLG